MTRQPQQRKGNTPAKLSDPGRVREELLTWEGPVPPPQVIEAYDRLVPGAAEKMWRNFDEQSTHRRDLEKSVVGNSEMRANRGQFLAAGLILVAMIFGLVIALTVNATVGGVVIVGSIASGAAIYIAGGRQSDVKSGNEEETA